MSDIPTRIPILDVQQQEETPEDNPSKNQKTRSLRELYEQTFVINENLQYLRFWCQPKFFDEALKDGQWVHSMNEYAIEKNETWDLNDIPANKTSIAVKWVQNTKLNEKGELEKHKARLVSKGYAHQYGVDYEETFSLVARVDTVRAVLAIAVENQWLVYQMDVKSSILNGILEEEVYVDQSLGYTVKGH